MYYLYIEIRYGDGKKHYKIFFGMEKKAWPKAFNSQGGAANR